MGWMKKMPDGPPGWVSCWKLWRHCFCRYGWWPLLVALVCTAALLLDLYSSFSCEFLQVNVGFNPSNVGWNQSTVNIGIFFFESESLDEEFGDNVVKGCVRFSDSFEQQFIKGDKTWTATQIMALVAAISGMIATVSTFHVAKVLKAMLVTCWCSLISFIVTNNRWLHGSW